MFILKDFIQFCKLNWKQPREASTSVGAFVFLFINWFGLAPVRGANTQQMF